MSKTQATVHLTVALALLLAYVVVTVSGHDANGLLGLLVGYIGGAGASVAAEKTAQKGE